MKVVEGSKICKPTAPYYVELSNSYATLDKFLSNPDPPTKEERSVGSSRQADSSTFKAKAAAQRKSKTIAYIAAMNDAGIIDLHISLAEDERTATAKRTGRKEQHSYKTTVRPSALEKGWGLGPTIAAAARRLLKQTKNKTKQRVRFARKAEILF